MNIHDTRHIPSAFPQDAVMETVAIVLPRRITLCTCNGVECLQGQANSSAEDFQSCGFFKMYYLFLVVMD